MAKREGVGEEEKRENQWRGLRRKTVMFLAVVLLENFGGTGKADAYR